MALDFPSNPVNGQVYDSYYYDSVMGTWRAQGSGLALNAFVNPTITGGTISGLSTDLAIADGGTGASTIAGAQTNLQIPLSPNYIINGGFDIWQRGTTSPVMIDAYGSADRWVIARGILARNSTSSQTWNVVPYYANFSWTSQAWTYIAQRVEDVTLTSGKTLTLSFWAKSSTSSTASLRLTQNFGSGGSTQNPVMALGGVGAKVFSFTTSWTRYSYTFTLPSVGGFTVGTPSTSFLDVALYGNASATATSGNFDIAQIQLEEGAVATPFRRNANSLQGELAACQRYYCSSYDVGILPGAGSTTGAAMGVISSSLTTFAGTNIRFPVTMRATPAVSLYAVNGTANQADAVGYGNISATVSTSRVGNSGIAAIDVATGRAGGTVIVFHYVANAEI